MLQMLFSLFIIGAVAEENHNINNYNNPVIKELMSDIYIYNNIWETMHFIDLSRLQNEIKHDVAHIQSLISECKNFEGCNALPSLANLHSFASGIAQQIKTLNLLSKNSRNKRGLIDGVGYGLN